MRLDVTCEVDDGDVDRLRGEHPGLSDDDLVRRAVREYAALLGRRQLMDLSGVPWDVPGEDAGREPEPREPAVAPVPSVPSGEFVGAR